MKPFLPHSCLIPVPKGIISSYQVILQFSWLFGHMLLSTLSLWSLAFLLYKLYQKQKSDVLESVVVCYSMWHIGTVEQRRSKIFWLFANSYYLRGLNLHCQFNHEWQTVTQSIPLYYILKCHVHICISLGFHYFDGKPTCELHWTGCSSMEPKQNIWYILVHTKLVWNWLNWLWKSNVKKNALHDSIKHTLFISIQST